MPCGHRNGTTGFSCLKDNWKFPSLRKEGKSTPVKEIDEIIIDCTCMYELSFIVSANYVHYVYLWIEMT